MSDSDPVGEAFPFEFQSPAGDAYLVVRNGSEQVMGQGYGGVALALPRGVYTVRVELAGQSEETVVVHTAATRRAAKLPNFYYSPVPLTRAFGVSPRTIEASREWSMKTTAPAWSAQGKPDAALYLFIRRSEANTREPPQAAELLGQLSIRDDSGTVRSRFAAHAIRRAADGVWAAFSVAADSGRYFLRLDDVAAREIPVHLFPGRQTQVFVLWHNRPVLEGLRIFLPRKEQGFCPDDRLTYAVDRAMLAWQNNEAFFPDELLADFRAKRFTDLLGSLLAAHWLLRCDGVDVVGMKDVLTQLARQLPGSPDMAALEIRAALRAGAPLPSISVRQAPMLRAGLEALLEAERPSASVIPKDSPLDRLQTHLEADSPWCTWKPLEESSDQIGLAAPLLAISSGAVLVLLANAERLADLNPQLLPIVELLRTDFTGGGRILTINPLHWLVGAAVVGLVGGLAFAVRHWLPRNEAPNWVYLNLQGFLLWHLKTDRPAEVRDLARRLGVTTRAVERTLEELLVSATFVEQLAGDAKVPPETVRRKLRATLLTAPSRRTVEQAPGEQTVAAPAEVTPLELPATTLSPPSPDENRPAVQAVRRRDGPRLVDPLRAVLRALAANYAGNEQPAANRALTQEMFQQCCGAARLSPEEQRFFFETAANVLHGVIVAAAHRAQSHPGHAKQRSSDKVRSMSLGPTTIYLAANFPQTVLARQERYERLAMAQPMLGTIYLLAEFAGRVPREMANLLDGDAEDLEQDLKLALVEVHEDP